MILCFSISQEEMEKTISQEEMEKTISQEEMEKTISQEEMEKSRIQIPRQDQGGTLISSWR
jgi:predicted nucleic acid-binding protein